MKRKLLIMVMLGFISLIFINQAWAIPTFARKYRTSCTTCHIGYNKLNPFGEAYKLNGYNIPKGEAAYVKEEPVSLGAAAWKKVWPDAVWPTAIPAYVPISMMVHQRAKWNEAHEGTTPQIDFDFPREWELLVGGTLDPMFSFYGEFVLYETGEGVAGTERLFLTLNDLGAGDFGLLPEDSLNLKIGHFDIAADPFPGPTRRTLTAYLPSNYTVGSSGFRLRNRQSGFETYGLWKGRLQYALGLVNGNSALGSDNNSHKDLYWRVGYKLGGMGLDGSGEALGEELKQSNNWQEKSLLLSGFGYYGKERVTAAYNNPLRRLGLSLQGRCQDLELLGALVFGKDEDPNGTSVSVKTRGWLAQLDYVFYPWLIGALRCESIHYDDNTSDTIRWIPSLSLFVRANVKLALEGILYPSADDGNDEALADLSILF